MLIERLKELRPEEPVHLVVLPQKLAAARKHLGRPKGFTIHRGDVASTDLGLGADSLSELLPTVRQIIHFAQIHHPSAGRKSAIRSTFMAPRTRCALRKIAPPLKAELPPVSST